MVNCDMSLNEEHVEARIREVNDAVQMLRDLTGKGFGELTVHERLSMRYLLIQLVEAASGICMHILLSVFNEGAEGFPECFARLGGKGVISEDLAPRLSSAARLRNLLVHRYWVINDEEVYKSVKKGLKDFEFFVHHVRVFLRGEA
ncbi:MAG: hypothetical protein AOA66_1147 [Candidatus Bathyarchaeota archaeon BA2]|nr:MAG: hypothetical protein AOA66_1147 [Candidatus Bathyarchaeota archaeon BA2]